MVLDVAYRGLLDRARAIRRDDCQRAYLYRNEECADLAVVKAVTPASAAPGAAITYTLRFTNTGPGSARGVVIRDSIPVSVTISRVTSSTVGSGCASPRPAPGRTSPGP
mgnify:CR=1 FL=1